MDLRLFFSMLTFILLFIVHEVSAEHVFNVYRMLQYDTSVNKSLSSIGAQRTSVNSHAVTHNTKLERLERHIVLVPAEQLTSELVDNLLVQRGADGLVVLLPNNTSTLKDSTWRATEKQLVSQKFSGAIYFAYWDTEVRNLFEELNNDELSKSATNFIGADTYRLEVTPPTPVAIKEVNLATIQGWLPGSTRTNRVVPTVAIVAYTDSFSAAPALAYGADSNGSGMAALLELARIFSRLYKNPRTQAEFNLLFLLTSAGRQNFIGTKLWLERADSRLKSSIDLALCLDTIGNSDGIHLHVSRTDKDPKAKKVFEIFQSVASDLSVPFQIVHKKINVSNPEIPWEHEHFAMASIFGMTLSNLPKAEVGMSRADISDGILDPAHVAKNVKFVGEVLARYLYNLPSTNKISVFSNEFSPSHSYISSWASTIAKYPRMMPYFSKPSLATSSSEKKSSKEKEKEKEKEVENYFLDGLERELARYLPDVSQKSVKLSATELEYTFYTSIQSEMSAFRKKPFLFDVLLSVVITVYLSLLYTFLKGPAETIRQVKSLFASTKKRR